MPCYEYRCTNEDCQSKYEAVCPMEERHQQPCSLCGARGRLLPQAAHFDMGRDGTRNRNKIPRWSIKDRMNSKYGDNL